MIIFIIDPLNIYPDFTGDRVKERKEKGRRKMVEEKDQEIYEVDIKRKRKGYKL